MDAISKLSLIKSLQASSKPEMDWLKERLDTLVDVVCARPEPRLHPAPMVHAALSIKEELTKG